MNMEQGVYQYTQDNLSQLFIAQASARDLYHRRQGHWEVERFEGAPDDTTVIGSSKDAQSHELLFQWGGKTISLVKTHYHTMYKTLTVDIQARSEEEAENVLARLRLLYPETKEEETRIKITVWADSQHGPASYPRVLDAQTYDEIKDNYTAHVQKALADLVAWRPESTDSGKLILWHGEPGTGKTWSIRMLAREWASWCDVHFISDPEQFFGINPNYLFQVAVHDEDNNSYLPAIADSPATNNQHGKKWRLLILEDSGELLDEDARQRAGQGLSRFLNLTDGLLGQGLRSLVLVTTNEPLDKLHEAVRRPGRCRMSLHFDPMSQAEALQWLDARGHHVDINKAYAAPPTRLSDLYDIVTPSQISSDAIKGYHKIGF